MTNTFRSLLLLAATAVMASTAQAAPVTFNFNGKSTNSSGFDPVFGATVTGTITIDLSAAPSTPSTTPGQPSEWRNVPNIKITAKADNFNAGTGSFSLVDDTVLQQLNPMYFVPGMRIGAIYSWLGFNQLDGSDIQQIQVYINSGPVDDNNGLINKIFDPSIAPANVGSIILYDSTHAAYFDIQGTLTPAVTTILIDGKDTGIKDITYQGQSVSAILAGYAASAKNHGDYVSSVEKLVEKLLKAKLLTKAQAETLKKAAEKSSIGQKPKKEKEDKDDKGKSDKDDDDNDDD